MGEGRERCPFCGDPLPHARIHTPRGAHPFWQEGQALIGRDLGLGGVDARELVLILRRLETGGRGAAGKLPHPVRKRSPDPPAAGWHVCAPAWTPRADHRSWKGAGANSDRDRGSNEVISSRRAGAFAPCKANPAAPTSPCAGGAENPFPRPQGPRGARPFHRFARAPNRMRPGETFVVEEALVASRSRDPYLWS